MKTITQKIEDLTQEPGYIYTLALILLRDLFMLPEQIADINPREHLNIQELTFLVGLVVKHPINFTVPTEDESEKKFESTYQLFEELHKKYHEPFIKEIAKNFEHGLQTETPQENYRRIFGAGLIAAEPIFYSASGAYDFQYLEFAIQKYLHDAPWIDEHIGVDVLTMTEIAREFKRLHELKFNHLIEQLPDEFSERCKAGLSVFCFEEKDIERFGTRIRPFIKAFSLTPGTVNLNLQLPGQYNELQAKPIICLPDGRYFLPIGFNVSEAIYESPFYWMNIDRSYISTALLNRGRFAESATAGLLKNVFGVDNVYCDVEIREKKGHTVTDIDVLAIVGNKAIIAQVKSKRLTELAKLGDEGRLVSDFESAVQEAYEQALLSRTAIIDRTNKLFVNGIELNLNEAIDDAYILCVTVDFYPAITHQVDVYLKKKSDDPFPVALSIFDLDVIAFYLRDPFEFAYYLRQRISLSNYFKADSEMTLLGHHLKHKLFKSRKASRELLDSSYAQLIDANFQVVRGSVPHTHAAERLHSSWNNNDFKKLVNQVKAVSDPRVTDLLFFLYDLAGKGADDLVELIKRTKSKAAADHDQHDARLLFEDGDLDKRSGITILCEPDLSVNLKNRLLSLSEIAKYKSRAEVWLALGCYASSGNLVDELVFSRHEWKQDAELEKLSSHLQGKLIMTNGQKIGRNSPCPCQSGKKFKRCCGR